MQGFSVFAPKIFNIKLTVIINDKKVKRKTQENNYFVSLTANWIKNEKQH